MATAPPAPAPHAPSPVHKPSAARHIAQPVPPASSEPLANDRSSDGLIQLPPLKQRNERAAGGINAPLGARDHYDNGVAAFQAGDYEAAIGEFEQAYFIKPRPAFLYDLAQACRLGGHPGQALRHYRLYLRTFPNAPNRADVEARIAALEATWRPAAERR
jgi:tetratricopeptide (TPR) repeat protein